MSAGITGNLKAFQDAATIQARSQESVFNSRASERTSFINQQGQKLIDLFKTNAPAAQAKATVPIVDSKEEKKSPRMHTTTTLSGCANVDGLQKHSATEYTNGSVMECTYLGQQLINSRDVTPNYWGKTHADVAMRTKEREARNTQNKLAALFLLAGLATAVYITTIR